MLIAINLDTTASTPEIGQILKITAVHFDLAGYRQSAYDSFECLIRHPRVVGDPKQICEPQSLNYLTEIYRPIGDRIEKCPICNNHMYMCSGYFKRNCAKCRQYSLCPVEVKEVANSFATWIYLTNHKGPKYPVNLVGLNPYVHILPFLRALPRWNKVDHLFQGIHIDPRIFNYGHKFNKDSDIIDELIRLMREYAPNQPKDRNWLDEILEGKPQPELQTPSRWLLNSGYPAHVKPLKDGKVDLKAASQGDAQ